MQGRRVSANGCEKRLAAPVVGQTRLPPLSIIRLRLIVSARTLKKPQPRLAILSNLHAQVPADKPTPPGSGPSHIRPRGKAAIPSSKPMSQLYPLYAFLFNAPGSHGGAGMILLTAVGQVTSNYQPWRSVLIIRPFCCLYLVSSMMCSSAV
ncbi:hypothetical protein E2P81_ATG00978 [Venturia nashicola]|nr:hypothetical protein E2P81_ATG00978 [Venturia nashicola]